MSIKIAFVLNYFVSKNVLGGTDRLVIALAKELEQHGYEVNLFFPKMDLSDLYHYEKAKVNANLLEGKLFSEEVLDVLKKDEYRLVVTHFFTPYSKYLKIYHKYVKHIISVEHMSRPIEGKSLKRRMKDKVQYFLYEKYVDKVIHCCDYLREQDVIDYSIHVGKKSLTVYNGIETKGEVNFKDSRLNTDDLRITCIGRLVEEKGFQHAIEALKQLSMKNVSLDIYGNGNYKTELEELAKGDERIAFHGFVSNIQDVLEEADILLLPSYQEAFPFVILEACAVGTTVIATNVGGIPEIILDNKNGFLIEPKNTDDIVKVLNDIIFNKENLVAIQNEAYMCVKDKFSFSLMIDGHSDLIRGVLES